MNECKDCRYLNPRILELSKNQYGCMKTKGKYDLASDVIIRDFSCFKPIGWMDEIEKEAERVRIARAKYDRG